MGSKATALLSILAATGLGSPWGPPPPVPRPRQSDRSEGDWDRLESAEYRRLWRRIRNLRVIGHTDHCAQRIVLGDGGCECGVDRE